MPPNSSLLGLPTSDEKDVAGIRGAKLSTFERGSIYWTAKLGPVIVGQPILDGFLISGGVSHWGMPTAPARVAAHGDTTVTWQTFERGVLAHTDKVGWFDSLQMRIARVDTDSIDDTGPFAPNDRKAELFIKAWVWVNGAEVLRRESPAGDNPSFTVVDGWVTGEIPLREDARIDIKIEAWDWDQGPNDHFADHSATFTFGEDLFGYARNLGTSHGRSQRGTTATMHPPPPRISRTRSLRSSPQPSAACGSTTSIDSATAGEGCFPGTSTTRPSADIEAADQGIGRQG